jgi:hypothetical protein
MSEKYPIEIMNHITRNLKAELWRRFGDPNYPAEWDGVVYGGGKGSQRFWEYFKAIELLELNDDNHVIDIGGGSPKTGISFFSSLLASHIKLLEVIDPCIDTSKSLPKNVKIHAQYANYNILKDILSDTNPSSRIVSVSVFEHIPEEGQIEIIRAIDEFSQADSFVLTLEYHPVVKFFDSQLTAKSLGKILSYFKNHYMDKMEGSPIHSENAFVRVLSPKDNTPNQFTLMPLPCWYPLAMRFRRMSK